MSVKKILIVLLAAGLALLAGTGIRDFLKGRFEQKVRLKVKNIISFDSLEFRGLGIFVPAFKAAGGLRGSGLHARPDDLGLFVQGKSGQFSFTAESLWLTGLGVEKAQGTASKAAGGRWDVRASGRVPSLDGEVAFRGSLDSREGRFSAEGRLSSESLKAGGVAIRSLECDGRARSDRADFSRIAFDVCRGRALGKGSLWRQKGGFAYAFDMEYRDVDLNLLKARDAGVSFSGRFSGSSRVKGSAKDFREVMGRLAGMGDFNRE